MSAFDGPPPRNGRPVGDYGDGEPPRAKLVDYLRVLRRHSRLVLAFVVIVGALATYKALTDPSQYRSGAVIRLRSQRQAMMGSLGGAAAPMGGGFLGGSADPYLSQIEVLRSRSVTSMVVDEEGLRLRPTDLDFPFALIEGVVIDPASLADSVHLEFDESTYRARIEGVTHEAGYGRPVAAAGVGLTVIAQPAYEEMSFNILPRDLAAADLVNRLDTDKRQSTDVIDVRYVTFDPVLSQRVVNSLVEQFQDFNARREREEARLRREFIAEQMTYTDSLLRVAQGELAMFREREHVYSSQQQFAQSQAQLMELDIQRAQLQSELDLAERLLGRLEVPTTASAEGIRTLVSVPELAQNPIILSLYNQLVEYEVARDTMTSAGRATSNPDVQQAEMLIGSTRERLMSAVQSHAASLEARLQAMDGLADYRRSNMEAMPQTESEEVRLLSEVEYVGEMAAQLRSEYQRAQIAEAAEAGQVEIVDPALPGIPVHGARIRTVMFGLALGLMLGGGGAFLLESLNTSIRRKDEIEEVLHIPELAVIPNTQGTSGVMRRLRLPIGGGSSSNGNGKQSSSSGGKSSELVASSNAHSTAAEAYRSLRTNLLFSQTSEDLRVLLVTSSAPGEGKSTTASNLAVAFAQHGRRVLLVDCDLRKARLHRVFQVPREPGLTQLILGLKEIGEVVRPTGIENLAFLAAGTLPPNPSEMVGGPRMHSTLQALSNEFDLVIVDTPPLLAASDAAVLGRFADGVLLVVRAGHTEREAAKQSVRKLATTGAHVVGAVLNDPDSKVGKYGGHYEYEYYGSHQHA